MNVWRWLLDTAAGWSSLAIMIRLVFALIIGIMVGIDRGMKRRGAGIKTHALVCLGAAIVMVTSQYMMLQFPDAKADMARMGAQVISGVGFLGVGTIMVTGKNQVRGLTTAAGLWACACLGLAVGIGFIEGTVYTLALIMFTLKILTRVDMWINKHARVFQLYLEFDNYRDVASLVKELRGEGVKVSNVEINKSKIKGEGPNAVMSLEIMDKNKRLTILEDLQSNKYVHFVEEI
ncbi:MAG: MgtC/SapB family protein [Lachnospiraceae bacterium]|nr:MgtC/SapB family protein [Lachnospiraceae bacterium]